MRSRVGHRIANGSISLHTCCTTFESLCMMNTAVLLLPTLSRFSYRRNLEEWEILVAWSPADDAAHSLSISLRAGKGSEINNCLRKRWAETWRFVAVFVLLIRVSRREAARRCSATMKAHFALVLVYSWACLRNDFRYPRHLPPNYSLWYSFILQVI